MSASCTAPSASHSDRKRGGGVIELFSRQVRLPDDELLKMIDDIV